MVRGDQDSFSGGDLDRLLAVDDVFLEGGHGRQLLSIKDLSSGGGGCASTY